MSTKSRAASQPAATPIHFGGLCKSLKFISSFLSGFGGSMADEWQWIHETAQRPKEVLKSSGKKLGTSMGTK
jgi:hypothetical protein